MQNFKSWQEYSGQGKRIKCKLKERIFSARKMKVWNFSILV